MKAIGQPGRDLMTHGHLLVRGVIRRDDWIMESFLDLAAGSRTDWTPKQWDALLSEIRASDLTIEEWVTFYGD